MKREGSETFGQEITFIDKIDRWYRDILTLELQHREAGVRLKKHSQTLGIPTLVLSAVLATAAITSLIETSDSSIIRTAIGLLGFLSAVLVALQKDFCFSEKATKHKVAADGFEILKDELQAIEDHRDEKELENFCKSSYPNRKHTLLKDTDIISENIRNHVEASVGKIMEERHADRKHRDIWDPFIERDRVYSDVESILDKLEKEEEGPSFVFKMRRELNKIHLGREPKFAAKDVKEMLHKLQLYTGADREKNFFDDNITPTFIEAVMGFQRIYCLEQVDGIAGPYTKTMLKEAVGQIE